MAPKPHNIMERAYVPPPDSPSPSVTSAPQKWVFPAKSRDFPCTHFGAFFSARRQPPVFFELFCQGIGFRLEPDFMYVCFVKIRTPLLPANDPAHQACHLLKLSAVDRSTDVQPRRQKRFSRIGGVLMGLTENWGPTAP